MSHFIEVVNDVPYHRFIINFRQVRMVTKSNAGKAKIEMFNGDIHCLNNSYDDIKKKMISRNLLNE